VYSATAYAVVALLVGLAVPSRMVELRIR